MRQCRVCGIAIGHDGDACAACYGVVAGQDEKRYCVELTRGQMLLMRSALDRLVSDPGVDVISRKMFVSVDCLLGDYLERVAKANGEGE